MCPYTIKAALLLRIRIPCRGRLRIRVVQEGWTTWMACFAKTSELDAASWLVTLSPDETVNL